MINSSRLTGRRGRHHPRTQSSVTIPRLSDARGVSLDVHGAAQRVADPLSAFAEPKGALSHLARRGSIAASYQTPKPLNLLNPSPAVT
jgi:hypothetical protein